MLICKHNLRICNNIASMKFYPIKSIQSLTALAALSFTLGTLVACSNPSTTSAEPTLSSVIGNRFTIGAAVNGEQMAGRDPLSVAIVRKHFNSIVAENEMKCENIHPFEDVYDFAGADSLVNFGTENNMEIIGHCLLWHSQCAPWFCVDSLGNEVAPEVLRERIREHITTIVSRYKGKVHGWDVVNEVVVEDGSFRNTPFFRILGTEFIYEAFRIAHEADPDAELYINDYGMTAPGRLQTTLAIVDTLRARGLRIDGVGLQGHMGMDYPSIESKEQCILAFKAKNIPVMITEWDMSALPTVTMSANIADGDTIRATPENDPYAQALPDSVSQLWNSRMAQFLNLFIRHSDVVKRVTFWGVTDAMSWKNDFPIFGRHDYPLPFDRMGQPKSFVKDLLDNGIQSDNNEN